MLHAEFLRSKTDKNKRNNHLAGKIRKSNLKVVKYARCILEGCVTKIKNLYKKDNNRSCQLQRQYVNSNHTDDDLHIKSDNQLDL